MSYCWRKRDKDPDEIVDEEPIKTGKNIGNNDRLEDFEDLLKSGTFVESNYEEMPSNKQKLMDKWLEFKMKY